MDDTSLDSRHRIRGSNRLPEPGQAVHSEQVNVFDAPAFQVVEHAAPELRRLVFSNPDAQDILVPIHVYTQHNVGSLNLLCYQFYSCVKDFKQLPWGTLVCHNCHSRRWPVERRERFLFRNYG